MRHGWIYSLTIFLGAFLLFLIQPIIGKFLLPFFGGGSSVWSVSLVFFMTALLAGYLYAHWLSAFSKRKQLAIHSAVMIVGFIASFRIWSALGGRNVAVATGTAPEIELLKILFLTIGIPYLILSTTGPLLQFWYGGLKMVKSPYRLYALSNFGSLLAIGSYPFLIEPFSRLQTQGTAWTIFFWIFLSVFLLSLFVFVKKGLWGEQSRSLTPKIPAKSWALWLGLAFVPAVLLLSITNEVTQAIAPVPFLWLLPLGLYLLSFVIAFGLEFEPKGVVGFAVLLIVNVLVLLWGAYTGFIFLVQILLYFTVLFLGSLLCHVLLYRARPDRLGLTKFYIVVAAGGALGGMFVAFFAPLVFKDFWEAALGLFFVCLVALGVLREGSAALFSRLQAIFVALALALIFGLLMVRDQKGVIRSERNFYGVLSIKKQPYGKSLQLHTLYNGDILHGSQFFGEGSSQYEPTTYYTAESGIGQAFSAHPNRASGLRVGAIGLGVGTVAAYCGPRDYFRFYEINPAVIRIAQTEFSYLSNCQGHIEIQEGDARIELSKELRRGQRQNFDLLIVDAFTDDSIPVHLLTKEAFEIYISHLKPAGGVIAIHISNRYLNLEPVVSAASRHFNLDPETKFSNSLEHDGRPAIWILLRPNAGMSPDSSETLPLWTDSYSTLFRLLKF